MNNKFNLLAVLTLIIGIGLACSGSIGNQQAEANKLVEEANKKLEEAKTLMNKVEKDSQELFSAKVNTADDLKEYKEEKESEAKEIISGFEKVSSMLKEVSGKFDAASKMNVSEKYKEYAKLKADEFSKRAEAVNIHKGNAQAFVELDDPKKMLSKFEDNNKKSGNLMKEAEEIAEKAKKIETENKEIFKEN